MLTYQAPPAPRPAGLPEQVAVDVHLLAPEQGAELVGPHAQQVGERTGIAAETDVIVLVDDPGEVRQQDMGAPSR